MNSVTAGREAEEKAAKYLTAKGYEIIERNYTVRGGEIDIIAKDRFYTVFVEVKMRSSMEFGTGAEAVNKRKQGFLIRAANRYAYENGCLETPMRFDVIEITKREDKYFARHIVNAFEAN